MPNSKRRRTKRESAFHLTDPYHNSAMNFFETSECVEHSKTSNHMTVVCGDMNDLLQKPFH